MEFVLVQLNNFFLGRKSISACLCQIQKGKLHGSIDVGLSVMSIKKRARRIDLDTEEHIYHLKVRDWEGEDNVIRVGKKPVCLFAVTKWAATQTDRCWRHVLSVSSLSSVCVYRWSLRMCLMPGCVSCVTTVCTDRMRLCVRLVMPACVPSLLLPA